LVAYSAVLTLWIALQLIGARQLADFMLWPTAALAIPTAVYTAFLFAQAKGRDLWQSPLLSIHLLVHALLAGGAVWLMLAAMNSDVSAAIARNFTIVMVWLSIATLAAELLTTHPTVDARRAMSMIVGRPL